jgi:hypothetical protein
MSGLTGCGLYNSSLLVVRQSDLGHGVFANVSNDLNDTSIGHPNVSCSRPIFLNEDESAITIEMPSRAISKRHLVCLASCYAVVATGETDYLRVVRRRLHSDAGRVDCLGPVEPDIYPTQRTPHMRDQAVLVARAVSPDGYLRHRQSREVECPALPELSDRIEKGVIEPSQADLSSRCDRDDQIADMLTVRQ